MNRTITEVGRNICSGCGACYSVCPAHAISMVENSEGFLYPEINMSKCVNCGLCLTVCPAENSKSKNFKKPKCYAVMAKDNIREKSSSGGMFTLLADYILGNGGYVCGAAYDKDFSVHHIIIDNSDDLDKLRGSKYVQSVTGDCYKKIKSLLEEGKQVLFSGTPCQVAGMYGYLQGKVYDNLLTMELLCHGAPSYKILKKSLEEVCNFEDIERLNFRDKSLNWCSTSLVLYMKDGTKSVLNIKDFSYEKGFHKGLFNRMSCAPCKFAALPRQADITVADWWGINMFCKDMDDKKGTSLVLLNNKKAEKVYETIKPEAYKTKPISLKCAKQSVNKTIYRPLSHHLGREKFFDNFKKYSVSKSVDISIDNKYDVGVIGLFAENNYGCVLTGYALYHLVQELGYSAALIDRKYKSKRYKTSTMARKFLQKNNVVEIFDNDTIQLNNNFNTFICGSDQLWNYKLDLNHSKFYLLDFAQDIKNKISYATSFGERFYTNDNDNEYNICKFLFHRFNNISVREDYAVDIAQNLGISAVQVLDPVFVCDKNAYHTLAEKSSIKPDDDYILAYILDPNPEKNRILKYISEMMNKKLYVITDADHNKIKRKRINIGTVLEEVCLEDWLNYYKHAKFVVTDSFHGTCFSIIFEKQFISIGNINRGISRFKSLLKTFDLEENLCLSLNDIKNNNMLNISIEYSKVNGRVESLIINSKKWLEDALKAKLPECISQYDYFNLINYNNLKKSDISTSKYFYYVLVYWYYKVLFNLAIGQANKAHIMLKKAKYKKLLKRVR